MLRLLWVCAALLGCADGPSAGDGPEPDGGRVVDTGLALDGGPLDAGTEPDAETNPYLVHDVFENVPSPICTDLWDPVEGLTEGAYQWAAPSGTVIYVGDVTNDGRAEIFVRDFDLEDDLRQLGVTVWYYGACPMA